MALIPAMHMRGMLPLWVLLHFASRMTAAGELDCRRSGGHLAAVTAMCVLECLVRDTSFPLGASNMGIN